jgi:hypothetical protein
VFGQASRHYLVTSSIYVLVQDASAIHAPASKYLVESVHETQSLAVLPEQTAQLALQTAQVPELS